MNLAVDVRRLVKEKRQQRANAKTKKSVEDEPRKKRNVSPIGALSNELTAAYDSDSNSDFEHKKGSPPETSSHKTSIADSRKRAKPDLSTNESISSIQSRGILKRENSNDKPRQYKSVRFSDSDISVFEFEKDNSLSNRGLLLEPDRRLLAAFRNRRRQKIPKVPDKKQRAWLTNFASTDEEVHIEEAFEEIEEEDAAQDDENYHATAYEQADQVNSKAVASERESDGLAAMGSELSVLHTLRGLEKAEKQSEANTLFQRDDGLNSQRSIFESSFFDNPITNGSDQRDSNTSKVSNKSESSTGVVISNDFSLQDMLDEQFKEFERSIKDIEKDARSRSTASESLFSIYQTELISALESPVMHTVSLDDLKIKIKQAIDEGIPTIQEDHASVLDFDDHSEDFDDKMTNYLDRSWRLRSL